MRYHVSLIPQQTSMGCWAASIAMIFGWAQRVSIDPGAIAARDGYQRFLATGLPPSDSRILSSWGIEPVAPQSYSITGFMDLVHNYGPLWVAAAVPGAHIRVVTGFDPDPDPRRAQVHINDPWERGMRVFRMPNAGAVYSMSYMDFIGQQENLARQEMQEASPVYVAHLPSRPHGD